MAFVGWFGPRGLATIVFAILVLDEKLPGNDTIMVAAGWTVLLSVVGHGVTPNPVVKAIMYPGILVQVITTKRPSDDQSPRSF